MFVKQPNNTDTLNRINESELTALVNRYIITKYTYLISTKRLNKRIYQKDDKVVNSVQLMPVEEAKEIQDLKFPYFSEQHGWIVFDNRNLYSYDARTETFNEKRSSDLDFANTRNNLTGMWIVGYDKEMYNLRLPHIAFAEWISNLISNSFGLQPIDKALVYSLALIYYRRMFDIPESTPEDEIHLLTLKLKGIPHNEELLSKAYHESLEMTTLDDFCKVISTITGNPRLSGFDRGVLHRITRTGWIGMDNKENIAIALQYPPFWIAMCYGSLKKNLYSRTSIGDTMIRLSKRGNGEEFINGVNSLIMLGVKEE